MDIEQGERWRASIVMFVRDTALEVLFGTFPTREEAARAARDIKAVEFRDLASVAGVMRLEYVESIEELELSACVFSEVRLEVSTREQVRETDSRRLEVGQLGEFLGAHRFKVAAVGAQRIPDSTTTHLDFRVSASTALLAWGQVLLAVGCCLLAVYGVRETWRQEVPWLVALMWFGMGVLLHASSARIGLMMEPHTLAAHPDADERERLVARDAKQLVWVMGALSQLHLSVWWASLGPIVLVGVVMHSVGRHAGGEVLAFAGALLVGRWLMLESYSWVAQSLRVEGNRTWP